MRALWWIGLAGCGAPATLVSATTSYGQCLGECVFTMRFDDDAVVLDITDHDGTAYNHNTGVLTADGVARLDVVEAGLGRARLDAEYGCPGCDDGGVREAVIASVDTQATVRWEAGSPPGVLVRLDALVTDLDDALRRCVTTPDLAIDAGCVPEGQ